MSIDNSLKSKIEELFSLYKTLEKKHKKALIEISISEVPEIVYNSNAIENSTLTLQETTDIIFFDRIKKDHDIREIFEAKNLSKVLAHLHESPKEQLSVELILRLHKILLTSINDHIA